MPPQDFITPSINHNLVLLATAFGSFHPSVTDNFKIALGNGIDGIELQIAFFASPVKFYCAWVFCSRIFGFRERSGLTDH